MTDSHLNGTNETYVLSDRNAKEVARLNWQHEFTVKCCGNNLVLPPIPVSQLQDIADIACGTGIWLQQLSKTLPPKTDDGNQRSFTGFDISPAMFPSKDQSGPIKFVIQDILAPVPEEYIEKFDLVSIKMLCFVLKISDYPKMMENLVKMIKPGGYLQMIDLAHHLKQYNKYPTHDAAVEKLAGFWTGASFSSDVVATAMQKGVMPECMIDVKRFEHRWDERPEDAVNYWFQCWHGIYSQVLLRRGEVSSIEKGQETAAELTQWMKANMKPADIIGDASWVCLVARKRA